MNLPDRLIHARNDRATCKISRIVHKKNSDRMDNEENLHESQQVARTRKIQPLAYFIFTTRWLQLPLYLGLILAQCLYVYHFWVELLDLIGAVMGHEASLQHILDVVAIEGAARPTKITETTIMLVVLGLIDV